MAASVAKVVVDLALDREFDYRIPAHLADRVRVGSRVAVPFGRRHAQGYVVGLTNESAHPRLKELGDIVGRKPLLTEKILELARWMAKYYCCAVETAVKCTLPEAVRQGTVGWKERQFARLGEIPAGALDKLRRRAPKQARVVEVLEKAGEGMFVARLLEQARAPASAVRSLATKGLIVVSDRAEDRDPFAGEVFLPTQPLLLNPDQQQALELCRQRVDKPETPILIHGVTGSGKT
ncbi:primosomal protein N', partial [bacterium]|nr:primosomal protein N' [bacterium]